MDGWMDGGMDGWREGGREGQKCEGSNNQFSMKLIVAGLNLGCFQQDAVPVTQGSEYK